MLSFIGVLVCLCMLSGHTRALQVTPGSPCAAVCLNNPESDSQDPNSSTTETSELVCLNDEFSTQTAGIKYQNCMQCLQTSNSTSLGESDSSWFIYNARFAIDVCMFGFKNESKRVSSPCDVGQACKSLKTALLVGNMDPTRDIYEYCDADGGSFSGNKMDACTQCYGNTDTTSYLSNFLVALKAGCEQRPHDGALLGLSQSVFSSSAVEITDPPTETALTGTPGNATAMTTGAIVGIAIGGALLLFGGIGLFFVYHRKQKRLYNMNHFTEFDFQDQANRGRKSTSPQPLLLPGHGGSGRSSTSTPDPKSIGSNVYATYSVGNLSEYELSSKRQHINSHSRTNSRTSHYPSELEKEMQLGKIKIKPMPAMSRIHGYTSSMSSQTALPAVSHQQPPALPTYVPQAHSRQNSLADPAMALLSGNRQDSTTSHQAADPMETSYLHGLTTSSWRPMSEEASATSNANTQSTRQEPQQQQQQQQQQDSREHPSRWPSPSHNPYRASMGSKRPAPSAPTGSAVNPSNPAIAKIIATTQQTGSTSAATRTQQTSMLPHGIPPPPPGSKAPDLAVPLVPRIRVPKTYVPPSITVEEATPVERAS
ncbi:uncharacterized protein B0I36DRAFT_430710 [Microdochium trichocladiopsis]|uniref:LPXTG-domain-containing protein n=1 Tax=Microdochium trichocladiopsis TaxID=1682393 RepID=A0A9P8YCD2_9PEZI|nr:uncharacterized protein B0I36DRAFT_430710 [Microdochium trichocladiopsis]KAH7033503.1 hypothetical protein B0I36DRAFT_430710 [Microdochium trichocladiopsis]